MSRQRGNISLLLVCLALLGLSTGLYLFVWKRFSKRHKTPVQHTVDTPADKVLEYWTAEKMRDAKPAPMPHVQDQKDNARSSQQPDVSGSDRSEK